MKPVRDVLAPLAVACLLPCASLYGAEPKTIEPQTVHTALGQSATIKVDSSGADLLRIEITKAPAHGTADPKVAAGEILYAPTKEFCGDDELRYILETDKGKSGEAVVRVIVCPDNSPPILQPLKELVVEEEGKVEATLQATDPNAGDSFSFAIEKQPAHGKATMVDAKKGKLEYEPQKNFHGADSFSVVAKDDATTLSSKPLEVKVRVADPQEAASEAAKLDEYRSSIAGLIAGEDDTHKILRCSWQTQLCDQDRLDINAGTISTVLVTDLPATDRATVLVTSGEVAREAMKAWKEGRLNELNPDVAWHWKEVDGPGGQLAVDIHTRRSRAKDYGSREHFLAVRELSPHRPAILVRGDSRIALIEITLTTGDSLVRRSFSIPLHYRQWFLDAGGSFLFSLSTDDEIVTEKVLDEDGKPTGKVRVSKIRGKDQFSTDTAVMFHLVPSNYQAVAVAFGFSTDTGRSPSFYLGAGMRFRAGRRSLFTISGGVSAVQTTRFPDLTVGQEIADDSPRLSGRNEYDVSGYLGVTLGFSIGDANGAASENGSR